MFTNFTCIDGIQNRKLLEEMRREFWVTLDIIHFVWLYRQLDWHYTEEHLPLLSLTNHVFVQCRLAEAFVELTASAWYRHLCCCFNRASISSHCNCCCSYYFTLLKTTINSYCTKILSFLSIIAPPHLLVKCQNIILQWKSKNSIFLTIWFQAQTGNSIMYHHS